MAWNCRLLSEAVFYSKRFNLTRQKCFDHLSMFRHFICIFRIDKLMFVVQFDWQCVSHKHHSDIYVCENGQIWKKRNQMLSTFVAIECKAKPFQTVSFELERLSVLFNVFHSYIFETYITIMIMIRFFQKKWQRVRFFSGDLFNW